MHLILQKFIISILINLLQNIQVEFLIGINNLISYKIYKRDYS